MTDHPDYHALLAAVLADPEDDVPRLVAADWLEENAEDVDCPACRGFGYFNKGMGDYNLCHEEPRGRKDCRSGRVPNGFAEYGEFIRVQCELAAIGPDWQDDGPEESGPVDGRFIGGGEFVGETFARPPVGSRITGRFVAPKAVRRVPGLRVIRVSDDRGSDGFLVNAKRDEHSGKAYRRVAALRKRESELLESHGDRWAKAAMGDLYQPFLHGGGRATFNRGFVDEIRCQLRQWVGERCERCGGHGSLPGIDEGNCDICHGLGIVGGIGPDLVRRCPLTRVALSDAEFQPVEYLYGRWVFPAPGDDYIPDAVQYVIDRDHYTQQTALDAISDACLEWATRPTV